MNSLSKIINHIKLKGNFSPEIGIIIGSGLGEIKNKIQVETIIKYEEISGFPIPTVEGHFGEFIFGKIKNKNILISNGRFHYYEGWSKSQIESLVYIFHKLGIEKIIITNSSGSILKKNKPNTILKIIGYLDFTFKLNKNPSINYFDKINGEKLSNALDKAFFNKKILLKKGIYGWTLGPSYETPSEINYLKKMGVHAVGMSTVPELKITLKLKMEPIVISCLTNFAAGINSKPITHKDVIDSANKMSNNLFELITETIAIL